MLMVKNRFNYFSLKSDLASAMQHFVVPNLATARNWRELTAAAL